LTWEITLNKNPLTEWNKCDHNNTSSVNDANSLIWVHLMNKQNIQYTNHRKKMENQFWHFRALIISTSYSPNHSHHHPLMCPSSSTYPPKHSPRVRIFYKYYNLGLHELSIHSPKQNQ
jgi:hypothetical protein